jgi:hypothetical protein
MAKSRFTTDETEIRMLGLATRTMNHVTPEEIADNEAHDAALAKINAELRGDTSRFVAQRDEIEMLGKIVSVEDRLTPKQKADNAERARLMKELYPDEA